MDLISLASRRLVDPRRRKEQYSRLASGQRYSRQQFHRPEIGRETRTFTNASDGNEKLPILRRKRSGVTYSIGPRRRRIPSGPQKSSLGSYPSTYRDSKRKFIASSSLLLQRRPFPPSLSLLPACSKRFRAVANCSSCLENTDSVVEFAADSLEED